MWLLFSLVVSLLALRGCIAQDPALPYPPTDAYLSTTSILNHSSYIESLDDKNWLLTNIPFVDLPEKSVQDVYYYRASVVKRHLKFGHEGHGWVFTEFIHPVSWASKLQTIPDSAGHHMLEARWLRDPNYVKDLIQLYTRAGVEAQSGITYTQFIHRAIYEHAQATGDKSFLTAQLDSMIKMFYFWNVTMDNTTGLYHRNPLLDAQEYSLPNYLVGGPNGQPMQSWTDFENNFDLIWIGPEVYRPNFNAFMVAAAQAISDVAVMSGNSDLAQQWNSTASSLYTKMENLLYSQDINFWIDVVEGTNYKAIGRQLTGFYPYRFGVGTSKQMISGLEASLDGEGFVSAYGPTTLEQRNGYFTALKNTTYCCQWQGQSWPFSTSVYLLTLAVLARNNLSSVANAQFFQEAFMIYTNTNYKDGAPFTAESHYPTIDQWSGDSTNHSENYFHSTYIDNLFTNLIGVVPTLDDVLQLQPLVPSNWSYFVVESLPYHGSLFTLLWDQDGSHYTSFNHSQGLSVYQNSNLIYNQATLAAVNISLANSTSAVAKLASQPRYDNILANPNSPWGLPSVTADYCLSTNGDICPWQAWKMNDGLLWYDTTPDNFWTNNQSSTPYATIGVTLPSARSFSSVSLAILDDSASGGVLRCPAAIQIKDNDTGLVLAERNPWTTCQPNDLNTILFSVPDNDTSNTTTTNTSATGYTVTTSSLSITLLSQLRYAFAVSEIQIWTPSISSSSSSAYNQTSAPIPSTGIPRNGTYYPATSALLGTFIGSFEGRATGLNTSLYDGGVYLDNAGGWAEFAGIDVSPSAAADANGRTNRSVTIVGGGHGSLLVSANWLGANQTVSFDLANSSSSSATGPVTRTNRTVTLGLLRPGRNVVSLFWAGGRPWVEGIVVG